MHRCELLYLVVVHKYVENIKKELEKKRINVNEISHGFADMGQIDIIVPIIIKKWRGPN